MGISASTSSQTIQNDIITEAANDCETTGSANNITIIQGGSFTSPPDCPDGGTFTIDQSASKDSLCLINNLQTSAAENAVKLSQTTQADLGLSVTTDITEMLTSIQNISESGCTGDSSSTDLVLAKDVPIYACNYVITQNANTRNACIIENTQSTITDISEALANETDGSGLFDLAFGDGWGGIIAAVLIVVAIIVVVIILALVISSRNKKNITLEQDKSFNEATTDSLFSDIDVSSVSGGKSKSSKCTGWIVLAIILILFVVILLFMYYNKKHNRNRLGSKLLKNRLNGSDLENYSNKVMDAYKIAEIESESVKRKSSNTNHSLLRADSVQSSDTNQQSSDTNQQSSRTDSTQSPYTYTNDDGPQNYGIQPNIANTSLYYDDLDQYYKSLLD